MNTIPADFITKSIWSLLTVLLLLLVYYLVNIGNKFVNDEKKIEISNKNLLTSLAILILIYIFIKTLKKYPFLKSLITTIFVSMILAYAINPLINYLEEKNISRGKGVLIVYIIIIGLIIILGVSVIPNLFKEIKKLMTNFPYYVEELTIMINNLSDRLRSSIGEAPPILEALEESVLKSLRGLEDSIGKMVKTFATTILNMASRAVNIVLTPILTYYFLVDKDKIKMRVLALIPDKHREDIIYLARTIDSSLILFIRGRMIMSLYIAVAITIMLLFMRVEFAIVIGIITGLFDIVPYVGPFVGYLPAAFFALLSSPTKAFWVTVLFLSIQWVENNILAPIVIGDNMGLHPMTILLSIFIGGGMFGVFGMILSVPLVATIKILLVFFIDKRKNRNPYRLRDKGNY